MLSYKQFTESLIKPSDKPNTMSFWHGGDLGYSYSDSMSYKKGRYEFGVGLYLTTHYDTAKKYAKGSRKLYMITVEKGKNLSESTIDFEVVKQFVDRWVMTKKKKDVIQRLEKHNKEGKVPAEILSNIIINEEAIKPTNMDELRKLFLSQGIDYLLVNSPFGWGEKMMVLFNTKKIVDKIVVGPKDKIEEFDLPTDFN